MALLDFEVPSGYVYQSWNYVSKKVKYFVNGRALFTVNMYCTLAVNKRPAS